MTMILASFDVPKIQKAFPPSNSGPGGLMCW